MHIRCWELPGVRLRATLHTGHDAVCGLAFSGDGKRLAAAYGLAIEAGQVKLWDCATAIALSHDGKMIASGSGDGGLMVWNAHTGKVVNDELAGHSDVVTCLAFFPSPKPLNGRTCGRFT